MSNQSKMGQDGVYIAGPDKGVAFARDELAAYLLKMTGRRLAPIKEMGAAQFVLGTFEDLSEILGAGHTNDRWNDAVFLKSMPGRLIISGPNGRSVLFSVYAYLEDLGCRWLYPGPEGDDVPTGIGLRTDGLDRYETPSYRFRGFDAYASFFEEGRNFIDWMAKRRMNYYYQEGFPADHPCRYAIELFSKEEWIKRAAVREQVLPEARKRGLLIERFGHGWLDAVVELYAQEQHLSFDEAQQALRAKEVDGKTNLAGGVHVQLCFSHPDVRRLLVRHVCDYVVQHKEEQDIIGVLMADTSLACRCLRCQSRPFSAWYVDVIRQVAERLKQTAPNQVVEYSCYLSTWGAPRERLLDGLDNVFTAFATMCRDYRHALRDPACRYADWKPDFDDHNCIFELDKCHRPRNVDYIGAAREWRKYVSNPRFVLDYFNWQIGNHSEVDHVMTYLPDILAEDIRGYAAEQWEGGVSLQRCREAFPTHLVAETFARLLWDKSGDVYAIRAAYLKDMFGPWAQAVERHMDAMRAAFLNLTPHVELFQESTAVIVKVATALDAIRDRFDTTFPSDAFTGPYAARLVRLKFDLLFYRLRFKLRAAGRNNQYHQLQACMDESQAYVREHLDEIDVVTSADDFIYPAPDIIKVTQSLKEGNFSYSPG